MIGASGEANRRGGAVIGHFHRWKFQKRVSVVSRPPEEVSRARWRCRSTFSRARRRCRSTFSRPAAAAEEVFWARRRCRSTFSRSAAAADPPPVPEAVRFRAPPPLQRKFPGPAAYRPGPPPTNRTWLRTSSKHKTSAHVVNFRVGDSWVKGNILKLRFSVTNNVTTRKAC